MVNWQDLNVGDTFNTTPPIVILAKETNTYEGNLPIAIGTVWEQKKLIACEWLSIHTLSAVIPLLLPLKAKSNLDVTLYRVIEL